MKRVHVCRSLGTLLAHKKSIISIVYCYYHESTYRLEQQGSARPEEWEVRHVVGHSLHVIFQKAHSTRECWRKPGLSLPELLPQDYIWTLTVNSSSISKHTQKGQWHNLTCFCTFIQISQLMSVLQEERTKMTPLACKNIPIDAAPLSAHSGPWWPEHFLSLFGRLEGTSQQVSSQHESDVHSQFTPDFNPSYQQPIQPEKRAFLHMVSMVWMCFCPKQTDADEETRVGALLRQGPGQKFPYTLMQSHTLRTSCLFGSSSDDWL